MTSQNLSLAISDVYARSISTGKLTHSHRQVLMQALCSPLLGEEERCAIDRLLWSVSRGRFQLVDE
ncbi:MAG: hypothetical protein AAGH78_02800 [Cyanobacteria bacterium P01_H01_bin.58]